MEQFKLDPRLENVFFNSCDIWKGGSEIVPRYELFSKTGRLTIFFQMPDLAHLRAHGMKQIADLAAWNGASAAVVSAELMQPEAALAVLATHRSAEGMLGIAKSVPKCCPRRRAIKTVSNFLTVNFSMATLAPE